jgi:hypothetical protein
MNARIEKSEVENFRSLRDVSLRQQPAPERLGAAHEPPPSGITPALCDITTPSSRTDTDTWIDRPSR